MAGVPLAALNMAVRRRNYDEGQPCLSNQSSQRHLSLLSASCPPVADPSLHRATIAERPIRTVIYGTVQQGV